MLSIRLLFDVEQHGSLSYDTDRYKLYAVKTKAWDDRKPTVLITGGVHGYETSGVQGAPSLFERISRGVRETF